MARAKVASIPEVGQQAPEFHLPSAQGGQLKLSIRTVRGPVVVVFYRPWAEEDVKYFEELAAKEEDINLAAATLVGIGVAEPDAARDFVSRTGIHSYVLYDYSQVATREWGLLEKDGEHGEHSRPAVFIIGPDDNEVLNAWVDEKPSAEEIYTRIHEITGLPKPPEEEEEEEEKPRKKSSRRKKSGGEEGDEQQESAGGESPEKAGEQGSSPEGRQESSGDKAGEEQESGEEASGESVGAERQEASGGSPDDKQKPSGEEETGKEG